MDACVGNHETCRLRSNGEEEVVGQNSPALIKPKKPKTSAARSDRPRGEEDESEEMRRARMGPVMGRRETRRRGATGCSRAIPAMRRGMRSSAKGISDTPQSIHALRMAARWLRMAWRETPWKANRWVAKAMIMAEEGGKVAPWD